MITKALRKLPKEYRDEAKSLMNEFVENDGMSQKDAAREAMKVMLTEVLDSRDELIKKMSK